jgi:hypothetical protein
MTIRSRLPRVPWLGSRPKPLNETVTPAMKRAGAAVIEHGAEEYPEDLAERVYRAMAAARRLGIRLWN